MSQRKIISKARRLKELQRKAAFRADYVGAIHYDALARAADVVARNTRTQEPRHG